MHISANTEGNGLYWGIGNEVVGPRRWCAEQLPSEPKCLTDRVGWNSGKKPLWNVNTRRGGWAQSWPPARVPQAAIYGFINKWLDVKSLEVFSFPQQLQEQIITIQVGFQLKFIDWQESFIAVPMS